MSITIVPSKAIKDINNIFNSNIKYSILSVNERNELAHQIININNKYDINVLPQQIIEIRNTFIFLLSKTQGTRAHRLGDEIMNNYKSKMTIIDIANTYGLPPMSIVYQILIEKKYESHIIDNMMKKHKLPKDIQSQLADIVSCDPAFWYSCNIPNIYSKLNRLKCNIKVKYDIKKEINTDKCPDILIDEDGKPCVYKRQKFHWIVFKPYILFDNYLHTHDIQKTINNHSQLGTGLILYKDIICSKSYIKKMNVCINTYNFLD